MAGGVVGDRRRHDDETGQAGEIGDIERTRITGLVLTQIDPKGMKKYGYTGKYGPYGGYQSKYYEA